jgi:hypothetical protein
MSLELSGGAVLPPGGPDCKVGMVGELYPVTCITSRYHQGRMARPGDAAVEVTRVTPYAPARVPRQLGNRFAP